MKLEPEEMSTAILCKKIYGLREVIEVIKIELEEMSTDTLCKKIYGLREVIEVLSFIDKNRLELVKRLIINSDSKESTIAELREFFSNRGYDDQAARQALMSIHSVIKGFEND